MQTTTNYATAIENELDRLGCGIDNDLSYGLQAYTVEGGDTVEIFSEHEAGEYNTALALAILRSLETGEVSMYYDNHLNFRCVWNALIPAEI